MKTLPIFLLILFLKISILSQTHKDYIEGPFNSPQEITETCLVCHEEAAEDFMKTVHWTWKGEDYKRINGDIKNTGKINMINNFCIAVPSNWPRCTSCHAGYGWKDDSFDFSDPVNIDCLICHDLTGTYQKIPTGAGAPAENVDLLAVAQSAGLPTKRNCGICHFDGGGGTGVKHGDMDDSLLETDPEIDYHMGGLEFECTECHKTENHKILGASHSSMAAGKNHISCSKCHEGKFHKYKILDNHAESVACETCHIPTYAKVIPTKIYWDWSTAGQDSDVEKDNNEMPLYDKKKGTFIWGKDIRPEYYWYNGKAEYYNLGDKINPRNPVQLNKLSGKISDKNSKIYPFKVMRGKQIYDSENEILIVPNLFGKEGFWKTFDWNEASRIGMETVNLEYSGNYGFVETEMYWPINHMVVSADKALRCHQCHNSRGESVMNWKALGYPGDPRKTKGRAKNNLIR